MNQFMAVANSLAQSNLKTKNGGPFGACIVKNGQIIGKGSNNVLKNNDPTAHAEIMAIREACQNINSYDLSGCELYTSCYPCPMCLAAIIWSNIKVVYYGNTKEEAASIGCRDDYIYNFINKLNNDIVDGETLILHSMDRDETIKSFQQFKNDNNHVIY